MANVFHSGLVVVSAVGDRIVSPSQLISQYASTSAQFINTKIRPLRKCRYLSFYQDDRRAGTIFQQVDRGQKIKFYHVI